MRLIVCLSVLAMVGCVPTQQSVDEVNNRLAALESNLGGFAYLAVDPQLEIKIQKAEFKSAASKYSSPRVSYSIVVSQLADFAVDEYTVKAKLSAVDASGVDVGDIYVSLKMSNGVAADAGDASLYSLGSVSDFKGFKLRPVSYQWFPEASYKFVPGE